MEHEPLEPQDSPEHDTVRALEELPEVLGYHETEDLARMADELVEAMLAGAETVELATRYFDRARAMIDQTDDEHARLGLEIRMALLRRTGGRAEAYLEGIEAASVHAWQMGLDELAWFLEDQLPES